MDERTLRANAARNSQKRVSMSDISVDNDLLVIYRERVQRGAKMLDSVRPGWRDEISLGELNMRYPCYCILGQLWGNYFDAWTNLPKDDASDEITYGFDVTRYERHSPTAIDIGVAYNTLDTAWREELSSRKSATDAL